MDDLPDVEVRTTSEPIFRKDRHLSSALVMTEIEYMLHYETNPRALKKEHHMLLAELRGDSLTLVPPESLYAWYMSHILDHTRVVSSNRAELRKITEASTLALKMPYADWNHVTWEIHVDHFPELLLNVYERKCSMDDLFDEITYDTRFQAAWISGGVKGKAYGNLHIIRIDDKSAFVTTHAHLAGVRDLISAWFDVLLYSHINKHKYPGTNLYMEVSECIHMAREYAKDHPVDLYVLMKMWPSMCIGSILRDKEDYEVFLNALTPDIPHPRTRLSR